MVVMEIGDDDDIDLDLRERIEQSLTDGILEEESDEVVDLVLLWYREGDGDLADALVDAISPLAESGFIWLLTPKRGRDGYVEPSEIAEAAVIAGLSQTSLATFDGDWTGARLVGRRAAGGRR